MRRRTISSIVRQRQPIIDAGLTAPTATSEVRGRRILHVSQPSSEGVAVVLADLAEFQLNQGWQVHVACPPDSWLSERLSDRGVTVHAWRATRSPGPLTLIEVGRLNRLVRHVRPDVLHLHSSKAGLAGRLAIRSRVPTAFQPHAWSFLAAEGPVSHLSLAWERIASRWTDLMVAVSVDELRHGENSGISARRMVVSPNGVDVERFAPRDRSEACTELGLTKAPLVVCVGRLARQKGQDLLLAAWPIVLDSVPEARLALVGDGPEQAALREQLATLSDMVRNSVQMFPMSPIPEKWYAAATVVAVPSRWEGMALVPLEAIAAGRPVVGFDVAGLAEAIGGAGIVLPAEDIEAFAKELILRLTDDELNKHEGSIGRERALTYFDRQHSARQTDRALRELLPNRQPTPTAEIG